MPLKIFQEKFFGNFFISKYLQTNLKKETHKNKLLTSVIEKQITNWYQDKKIHTFCSAQCANVIIYDAYIRKHMVSTFKKY